MSKNSSKSINEDETEHFGGRVPSILVRRVEDLIRQNKERNKTSFLRNALQDYCDYLEGVDKPTLKNLSAKIEALNTTVSRLQKAIPLEIQSLREVGEIDTYVPEIIGYWVQKYSQVMKIEKMSDLESFVEFSHHREFVDKAVERIIELKWLTIEDGKLIWSNTLELIIPG